MDDLVENPRKLENALGLDDELSLLTISTFLLAAASWCISNFRENDSANAEDYRELGFADFSRIDLIDRRFLNADQYRNIDELAKSHSSESYYKALAGYIFEANEKGDLENLAKAVIFGLSSPDELVRSCALASSIEMFDLKNFNLWQRLSWYFSRKIGPLAREIVNIIINRAFQVSMNGAALNSDIGNALGSVKSNLILVHGTVLPTSQENAPIWSVPDVGELFKYISNHRSDIYRKKDYFRWEGGYTNYARSVASRNLSDWIDLRKMQGLDVVAHSHGCNVVIGAEHLGQIFGKAILLSCPVHINKYKPNPSNYKSITSVRVKLDLVILADRGGQRFPRGLLDERVLPFWFMGHSITTLPKTWQSKDLHKLL